MSPDPIDRMAAQVVPSAAELESVSPSFATALAQIFASQEGKVSTTEPGILSMPTRRRPLILVGVGAVAAALIGTVVVGLAGGLSPTVSTPTRLIYNAAAADTTDPALLLHRLADRAAVQPPKSGAGRIDYVQTRGWYLDTQAFTDGTIGQIDPTETEQWTAADGSGRMEETRSGKRTATSQVYAAGELPPPTPLPTDPTVLQRALLARHPIRGTAGWFMEMGDLWGPRVVEPPLQAAMLEVLAAKPDITVLGTVVDRVGRSGVAVGTRSNFGEPIDYTLVFDQTTGALLDFEQVALTSGDLPIHAPATISYTLWLVSGRVDSIDVRP